MNLDYTIRPTINYHLGSWLYLWQFTNNPLTTDYNALADIGLRGATLNRMFPRFTFAPTSGAGPPDHARDRRYEQHR